MTGQPPSPNGADGRDQTTGRFLPGNKGGPGNPFASKVARLKSALLEAVDEQDVRDVVASLVQHAKDGDTGAAKVLLDRALGPAKDAPEEPPVDVKELVLHCLEGLSGFARRQIIQIIEQEVQPADAAASIPRPG